MKHNGNRRATPIGGIGLPSAGAIALVLGTGLAGGCAHAPTEPVTPQAPPAEVASTINIPISVSLDLIAQAAEKDVPRVVGVEPFKYAVQGGAAAPACGTDVGYQLERGALAMTGSGGALVTRTDLNYWLKARKQEPCPGPAITASCGTDGEPPRTAGMSFSTRIKVQPDLAVTSRSTLGALQPGTRCVLRPTGVDVTDPLIAGLDRILRQMLPKLDQRIAASLDLRRRMQTGWSRLNEPAELRQGVWLAMNPEGIGVMPVTVDGGELRTGIQLRVKPVISTGAKPKVSPRTLPPAYPATHDDHFTLQVPVEVGHAFVQARLDQALDLDKGGLTVTSGSYTVHITGADVEGQGSQLSVKVTFDGDLKGTALLTGTPIYDAATSTLSFPDLDYTLDTDEFLLKSASWLGHAEVRDRLRQRFTVELAGKLEEVKKSLQAFLTRKSGNVQLRGQVDELELIAISRPPNGAVFTAFLSAHGKVDAEIEAPQ